MNTYLTKWDWADIRENATVKELSPLQVEMLIKQMLSQLTGIPLSRLGFKWSSEKRHGIEYWDVESPERDIKTTMPIRIYHKDGIIETLLNDTATEMNLDAENLVARYDDFGGIEIYEKPEPTRSLGNGEIILDDNTRIEFESLKLIGKSNPDSWYGKVKRMGRTLPL